MEQSVQKRSNKLGLTLPSPPPPFLRHHVLPKAQKEQLHKSRKSCHIETRSTCFENNVKSPFFVCNPEFFLLVAINNVTFTGFPPDVSRRQCPSEGICDYRGFHKKGHVTRPKKI